jgi:diketogulonate reductase-like aldo/keto reductase
VTVIAYSPLGHNIRHLTAALGNELRQVAQKTGKTVAQVALNWCLSRPNVVAIPKSNSVEHTLENCRASDWDLSQEHICLLDQA